jgi:hypothetical protein
MHTTKLFLAGIFTLIFGTTALNAQTYNIGTPVATALTATLSGSGSNKTLVISGSGAMINWGGPGAVPWNSERPNIKTLTIDSGLTNIGNSAFYNFTGLTSVTIPNSVTAIGFQSFRECANVTSATIPNSVNSIGQIAFYGCTNLTSVSIPNSINILDEYVFGLCSGLTSVDIPNSVTSIKTSAFRDCTALTTLTIGNSVASIGDYAFDGCANLGVITAGNPAPLFSPEMGIDIFMGVDKNACILQVPSNAVSAYETAPQWMDFINIVSSGQSAWNIGTPVITNVTATLSGSAPNYTLTINGNGAMQNFSTTNMPWSGVRNDIKTLIIQEGITSIGNNAFRFCTNAAGALSLPNSLTSIGDESFRYCNAITSVNIPNSLVSIGSNAFSFTNINSVTIPNSVMIIGNGTFSSCSNLTSINVNAANVNYSSDNGVLFNKLKTKLIQFPGGKTGNYTIPNSVDTINAGAFFECIGLNSVTIPASVISIEDFAFQACSGLSSIYCENINPANIALGNMVFDLVDKNTCILYVPNGSVSLYQNAPQWQDFLNINAILGINDVVKNNVKIYPNPTFGELRIVSSPNPSKGGELQSVEIFDMNGRKMNAKNISNAGNETKLDISFLPSGTYLLKINSETVKVIKK